jgi:transposase
MSRKYDKEFKLNAVKLVLEKKLTCMQVSQDLGIGLSSVQRWLHAVGKHGSTHAFPGSGNLRVEDEERRHLKRKIDVLRRERDILKKALAIFSSP